MPLYVFFLPFVPDSSVIQVDALRSQMSRLQSHHSAQLSEQSQLLDVHAARVRQLESQIRDMPYDTGMRQMHSGTNEVGNF